MVATPFDSASNCKESRMVDKAINIGSPSYSHFSSCRLACHSLEVSHEKTSAKIVGSCE